VITGPPDRCSSGGPRWASEAILLDPSHAPRVISTTTIVPTGTNTQGFQIATAAFLHGPYFDPPDDNKFNGAMLAFNAGAGTITVTVSDATAVGPNGVHTARQSIAHAIA
jgi:hypothetical protein